MTNQAHTQFSDTSLSLDRILSSLQYVDLRSAILASVSSVQKHHYSVQLHSQTEEGLGRYCVVESDICDRGTRLPGFGDLVQLPLFEAWPVFADSLLSTEIAVSTPCMRAANEPRRDESSETSEFTVQSFTALHYKLHQPLPGYLGRHLYRAGKHTVAFVKQQISIKGSDASLIRHIHEKLNRNSRSGHSHRDLVLPQFLDCNGTKGGRLKNRAYSGVLVETYRLEHLCHRLNILGKASLVLCDSLGVAVDAIRACVPVAFMSEIPQGFEKIQQSISDFLTHADRQRLIDEQQLILNDYLDKQLVSHQLLNHQGTLHTLIQRQISEVDKQRGRYANSHQVEQRFLDADTWPENNIDPRQGLILHTQQSMCSTPDKAVRLKSGIATGRRKLRKFKESPTRFLEDSQNTLLRSLAPSRYP